MFSLSILLIQIAVILITARVVGWIFKRLHQPQVVGEMVAGIMLGPSFLGSLAPGAFAALFPSWSLDFINALSQIGLVVFMFLVGLEVSPKLMRRHGHSAIAISHTSIIVPFLLGTLIAIFLYPKLSAATVPFTNFALFIGVSMSITAFPVLARILTDREMVHTSVGTVTIASAAVDDVTAWCILAAVVLVVGAVATPLPFWVTPIGACAYAVFMVFVGRRWLEKLGTHNKPGELSQNQLAIILLMVLASALVTETLGIHPLFGAFLLGAVMPKDSSFIGELNKKLEDIVVVLLVPLYFVFTGLRTSVGLISGPDTLIYFGLIMLVAIGGKFFGAFLASRLSGMSWREAGAIGVLMNTRGMVELVALNIGLDIGVISPLVFTLLVFMAVITTIMTTPILEWVYPVGMRGDRTRSMDRDFTKQVV
jgi:Kef-type K+ transport system membrane component KefB